MKRHNVSFLVAAIFIVAAFIAKYNTIKESIAQSGKWFKIIPGNAYWVLFFGGVLFAFLGSREYSEYEKRKKSEDGKNE